MDSEILETELGPVIIRRRKGRRRISIFMHPARPVEVRTNFSMPKFRIEEFLSEKKNWIEKNLKEFSAQRSSYPEKKFDEGEELHLFGQSYKLTFHSTADFKGSIQAKNRELVIFLPEHRRNQKEILQLIRRFYKETAIRYLTQRVEAWAARMSCWPKELKFNEARQQWGSCHSSGRVRLNWKLIVFEPHLIDYIVIHELAHLKHLNHSPAFWSLVGHYCPDFKRIRHLMKSKELMVAFLESPLS